MNPKDFPFDYPVSRSNLAKYYFPSNTTNSSVKKMNRWIKGDPSLRRELKSVGCFPRQKMFNSEQVEVFQKYFGN